MVSFTHQSTTRNHGWIVLSCEGSPLLPTVHHLLPPPATISCYRPPPPPLAAATAGHRRNWPLPPSRFFQQLVDLNLLSIS
ncbi:hypothetical protein VIGAN_07161800 [Vigna angularis var. angularis]|uniref:Uncharacterized protein n=1 Tax=Vigna angularis var. angularis TaxID=157739 RepID=A0A0S3SIW4_PHAAN|nr:hypothetical protein VIGAN_07161800 [Vigna angularis var. angularis]